MARRIGSLVQAKVKTRFSTGWCQPVAQQVVRAVDGQRIQPATAAVAPQLAPPLAASTARRRWRWPHGGVRASMVCFAPTVHGPGDHSFMATLVGTARDKGVSGYIDDGTSRAPAVHRLDAGNLVRLAVDDAPAGSVLHAIAEEGVATRAIAEAIGRGLDVPVVSVPAEQGSDHF